jgi:hypothetical protein
VKEPTVADTSKPTEPSVAEVTSPITAELSDFIARQRKEYSVYVAAQQIYAGLALAYNPGDAIPVENCERLGYLEEGLAVKVGTKAHKDLMESLGRPVS